MSIDEQRDELQEQIGRAESWLERTKNRHRSFQLGVGLVILGSMALIIYGRIFEPAHTQVTIQKIAFMLIAIALVIGTALWVWSNITSGKFMSERDYYQRKIRTLERLYGGGETPVEPTSYFDRLVQINVDNLADYYEMVKVHTDKSFKVSIAAGIFGFALISVGLIIGFQGASANEEIALIAAGSGVITEFIAGIFFYLYNRTVVQLKGYHDSLLAVQNVLLSFKLVGDLEDQTQKGNMIGSMLGFLIGRQAPPANLTEPSTETSSNSGLATS